jgi:phosphoribosylformylglycinamidine cyclo-ligase
VGLPPRTAGRECEPAEIRPGEREAETRIATPGGEFDVGPSANTNDVNAGDAYARAGVSQRRADAAVEALLESLRRIDPGRPTRQVVGAGHYASVLRLDERAGLALATDGVGTKLLVAEQLGRWDTVGIDCVAMNVNDLICVGAEPVAMLDYIAVPDADPEVMRDVGRGLRAGAERAGIEIPGGELAQLGEIVRGLDLVGACFGLVALDAIVDGSAIAAGDPVIGLPSSGLHSNGYTLARRALAGIAMDDDRLGAPLADVLLEPTEIYVAAVLELLRSPVEARGLAHITSGGLGNLLRLSSEVGYEIDSPLPAQPVFELIQERASVPDDEMREVFNMGCGFCCVVRPEDEDDALELLRSHYPDATRIGTATARAGELII